MIIKALENIYGNPIAKTALILAVVLMAAVFFRIVDLSPVVDENFFFSSGNPEFLDSKFILKLFPGQAALLVISATGDMNSSEYIKTIETLTEEIAQVNNVTDVRSLTRGPGGLEKAKKSPLWKRIIISEDNKSSNILVLLKDANAQAAVLEIENIISRSNNNGFKVIMSGVPYVIELIRRSLLRDLKIFTSIACLIFGAMILFMFRSLRILAGMLVVCVSASFAALIAMRIIGVKLGILTANIITIIFVVSLSHMVFLTHNWIDEAKSKEPGLSAFRAARATFHASFWCMFTTVLGFTSLLFVQARPLQELGIYGSIGTLSAFIMVYAVYPFFLSDKKHARPSFDAKFLEPMRNFFTSKEKLKACIVIALAAFVSIGISRINTDPSLIDFFKKGSNLRNGLEYIDINGGSTPLNIIVRDSRGGPLTSSKNYNRLWQLQRALESHESVGSILSLPVILAEGKRNPLSIIFTLEALTKILGFQAFGNISGKFITDDRVSAHFFARMHEEGREKPRAQIIKELKGIIIKHGFIPDMIGGLFILQGELARLVASSVIAGLNQLVLIFFFMALFVWRSLRVSLVMAVCVAIIPVFIFGVIGLLGMPIDLISAPAANIAIGMGIDSMIHMTQRYKRHQKAGVDKPWHVAQKQMWEPILGSMLIVSAGFAIFLISEFPPTQRFGTAIVFGTFAAAASAIFTFPFLAQAGVGRKRLVMTSG